ncbi:hypothetical protein [Fibrella aquatilis]|uniref:Uncharacterized protein n=1 Tax=Fibrella aquatilis TaxID=2817059 RepID=A0A939GAX9_9BACT|nr:hypothetical protein [Fibrella aquatilis]MBO0933899.1 hypothetical protein [Fibrella aquatilis]
MNEVLFGAETLVLAPADKKARLVQLNGIWVIQIKGETGGWGFAQRLTNEEQAQDTFNTMLATGRYIHDTSTP